MATKLLSVGIDASDPIALAGWWAEALGWRVTEAEPGVGARHVDIGQSGSEVPWIVLADPEGNELCVVPPDA